MMSNIPHRNPLNEFIKAHHTNTRVNLDRATKCNIRFKNIEKAPNAHIIDLSMYSTLQRYMGEVARARSELPEGASTRTTLNIDWKYLADTTIDDPFMYMFMNFATKYKFIDGSDSFKRLVSSIGLPSRKHKNITDYAITMEKFLRDRKRWIIKAFNIAFPHVDKDDEIRTTALGGGKYLQHVGEYSEIVLDKTITAADSITAIDKIYEYIARDYFKKYPSYPFLKSVAIINFVKEGKTVTTEWLNSLKKIVVVGNKLKQTGVPIDTTEKAIIRSLIRELYSAKNFHTLINNCISATEDSKMDYYNRYKSIISGIEQFVTDNPACNVSTFAKFIEYFIKLAWFMRDVVGYEHPVRSIVSDFKSCIPLRIVGSLRSVINTIITEKDDSYDFESEEFINLISEYETKWEYIDSARAHDPYSIEIYNKIGQLFVGTGIPKQYRVAIGMGVTAYCITIIKKTIDIEDRRDITFSFKYPSFPVEIPEIEPIHEEYIPVSVPIPRTTPKGSQLERTTPSESQLQRTTSVTRKKRSKVEEQPSCVEIIEDITLDAITFVV